MEMTHNVKALLSAGAFLAVAVAGSNAAHAQSCTATWTGNAGDGLWSNAANWSPRKVPGAASNVCIPLLTSADATPPISIHSLQLSGSLYMEKGKAGATFSVATSLTNQGFIFLYDQGTLSAGSIEMVDPSNTGYIAVYGTNSITSPAFSNSTGLVEVGDLGTLRLTDNPVQLQNGALSAGNWQVDSGGVLIIPSDISQITGPGGSSYTVFSVDGTASVLDTSGANALATLTSVGSHAVFSLFDDASLTVNQDLSNQGSINVGSGTGASLTIKGTHTVASGGNTSIGFGTLSASSVTVQSGGTLAGNGTVASSVTNEGTVSLRGSLTVTDNYSQAAGAALTELFGSTLNVTSSAALAGALNITINPKRPPKSGAQYTAVTAGSLGGSFASHTAGFTVTSNANTVTVTKQ